MAPSCSIYREKRSGLKMNPWGTPQSRGTDAEVHLPIFTVKVLSLRYEANHCNAAPWMPTTFYNWCNRILWLIVSKLALKSSRTSNVCDPVSRICKRSLCSFVHRSRTRLKSLEQALVPRGSVTVLSPLSGFSLGLVTGLWQYRFIMCLCLVWSSVSTWLSSCSCAMCSRVNRLPPRPSCYLIIVLSPTPVCLVYLLCCSLFNLFVCVVLCRFVVHFVSWLTPANRIDVIL